MQKKHKNWNAIQFINLTNVTIFKETVSKRKVVTFQINYIWYSRQVSKSEMSLHPQWGVEPNPLYISAQTPTGASG